MIKILCDKCGRDAGLNAFVLTTEIIQNPCPVHFRDRGNLQITGDHSAIKYILCQDCYIDLGLPNVYTAIRENKITFRD